MSRLKNVVFFFPFGICCVPAFDAFPNNFTIFPCICDVPILTWVILTNKPGTQLHVRETTVYLYWFLGVMPAETLTLCNVISATSLFCHLSLFFLLYPGQILSHLVKRDLWCLLGEVWNICLMFLLALAGEPEHCYQPSKRIFNKTPDPDTCAKSVV